MTVDQWVSAPQRFLVYILVPLVLVLAFRLGGFSDEAPQPAAEAAGPALSQSIGTAGSFVTLYRVEYEGQVYIVARGHNGAVAITRHEPAQED